MKDILLPALMVFLSGCLFGLFTAMIVDWYYEKKKKEVEKVRGQAHLSYQTGWGRDVLGCQPPLLWCACPARGGTVRQSYHTQGVLLRSRATRLCLDVWSR